MGTIIGTGVFLKTAKMAQAVGSPGLVLLAWLVAGLLSFAGALTYAELGAMLPHAGGEFVYLRAAYGPLPAFLFGWMRLAIRAAGSIAIFGVAFATFLSALIPLPAVWAEKTFRVFGQSFHWQFGSKQVAAVLVILIIYGLVNLAYRYALPMDEIMASSSTAHPDALPVATKAAQSFLGRAGGRLVSIAFVLSTVGALHGSILTNARITYAMARAGVFFRRFGELNGRTAVPVAAMVLQGIWACVLAVLGTFDQLTDCVVFASWIFYAATASAVFVLRRKMPDAPRPYRTSGYPIVPLLFIAVAAWLIVNTLVTNPIESAVGTFLILLGLPIYLFNRSRLITPTA